MKNAPDTTLFGEALQARMDELGLDIRQVAEKSETTYEYIRKMLRGQSLPSKYMLKLLCQSLKMDEQEMSKLMVTDRIKMKYGKMPSIISGKNPDLEPIERAWPKLSKEHREDIVRMARTWAQHDAADRKNA